MIRRSPSRSKLKSGRHITKDAAGFGKDEWPTNAAPISGGCVMAVAPDILCLVAEIRAGQAAQCHHPRHETHIRGPLHWP